MQDRQAKNLHTVQDALTEAWLRTHLLSRFARWITGIIIAVIVSVAITDATNTESDRAGCERRQAIFNVIPSVLDDAMANPDLSFKKRKFYHDQATIVRKGIVNDCNKAYPHAIPMRWFLR